ncbi:uncharacterized protein LOC108032362 [Drosophila biarmipes]|uniref:uncharacterized protein LOC108032362 n=1 Tax=Drosophila biarmipes TaxID=125945 RepID=UPI0007E645BB|nr:uncharacterized protein LOC108032362 [Drosophila biarmipes]
MLKYFLYVLVAWVLLESHAQEQPFSQHQNPVAQPQPSLADQIAAHQHQWFKYNSYQETETQGKIDKLESHVESLLQALQIKMGIELQELRSLIENATDEHT